MLKKEIVTHGDWSDDLPTLEDCTVLGACKDVQVDGLLQLILFLQKIVWRDLFVAPFRSFPFPFLVAILKEEKKRKKNNPQTKICKQIKYGWANAK